MSVYHIYPNIYFVGLTEVCAKFRIDINGTKQEGYAQLGLMLVETLRYNVAVNSTGNWGIL